jgi:hypothetical protein
MDQAQHYNEALRLLVAARISQDSLAEDELAGVSQDIIDSRRQLVAATLATAQVHATLCAAAPRYERRPVVLDDRAHLIEVQGLR